MDKNFSVGKGIAVLGICGLIGFIVHTTGNAEVLWILLLLLLIL